MMPWLNNYVRILNSTFSGRETHSHAFKHSKLEQALWSLHTNPKLYRLNTDDPPGEKVEMDLPVRANPLGITFNPVGQTLAALHRYSAGQQFASHS
eukprot:2876348-Ditylum_brightwellii.AAC.1